MLPPGVCILPKLLRWRARHREGMDGSGRGLRGRRRRVDGRVCVTTEEKMNMQAKPSKSGVPVHAIEHLVLVYPIYVS